MKITKEMKDLTRIKQNIIELAQQAYRNVVLAIEDDDGNYQDAFYVWQDLMKILDGDSAEWRFESEFNKFRGDNNHEKRMELINLFHDEPTGYITSPHNFWD
jgi:hypothetical protein